MKRHLENPQENKRQPKRQKIIDRKLDRDWEKILSTILLQSKNVDDHVIWTGLTFPGTDYCRWMYDGTSLPIYDWYYQCFNHDTIRSKETDLKKYCDEKRCISHYVLKQKGLTSVREMNSDDYFFACKQIEDNSEISDIDSGNSELKTKCRIWKKGHKNGYGIIGFLGKSCRASRVVIKLSKCDDFPDDLKCRHKCRNTMCVSEDHLELGTARDNALDRTRDGTNKKSTLSDEKIRQIFFSRLSGNSKEMRAKQFSVSEFMIYEIDYSKKCAHLFSSEDHAQLSHLPLKRRKSYKRLSREEKIKIKNMQSQKVSIEDCAAIFNVKKEKIKKVFEEEVGEISKISTLLQKSDFIESDLQLLKNRIKNSIFIENDEKRSNSLEMAEVY